MVLLVRAPVLSVKDVQPCAIANQGRDWSFLFVLSIDSLYESSVGVMQFFHFLKPFFLLKKSLKNAIKTELADHDIVGEGACLVREHNLVQGSGSRVQGFAVLGLGFRIQGLGVRVYGLGLRVHGLWFMV